MDKYKKNNARTPKTAKRLALLSFTVTSKVGGV